MSNGEVGSDFSPLISTHTFVCFIIVILSIFLLLFIGRRANHSYKEEVIRYVYEALICSQAQIVKIMDHFAVILSYLIPPFLR